MIKVAALTSGYSVPSARFRVRQHIAPLRDHGIEVREFAPAVEKYVPIPHWMAALRPRLGVPSFMIEASWRVVKRMARIPGVAGSWTGRVTWLERLLLPGRLTAERWVKRPLVFDVDDAIWLFQPFGREAAKKTAETAAVVVAGNAYIAEWFSKFSKAVRILPTAVDTERFAPVPGRQQKRDGTFVIGWIGTSSNLAYLAGIETPLRRFLADYPDSVLLVVSDSPPRFARLNPERVKFEPWTERGEVDAIRRMDVGLMPLPDNDWTRGKCSFKMLQYMACSIPALASPVGMNREILEKLGTSPAPTTEDDWYEALAHMHTEASCIVQLAEAGRALVEREFSREIVTQRLAQIFREVM